MKSKTVEEVLKERQECDYKKSASYLCKTLLTRNEELEKCVRALVEVLSTTEKSFDEWEAEVKTALSNAKKLLNNE